MNSIKITHAIAFAYANGKRLVKREYRDTSTYAIRRDLEAFSPEVSSIRIKIENKRDKRLVWIRYVPELARWVQTLHRTRIV